MITKKSSMKVLFNNKMCISHDKERQNLNSVEFIFGILYNIFLKKMKIKESKVTNLQNGINSFIFP